MQHNKNSQNGNRSTGYFAHERLDAYWVATEILQFTVERRKRMHGLPGGLLPQLERAVVGTVSNLRAGASARGAEGRRHFSIALSEAGEAAGVYQTIHLLGAISDEDYLGVRAKLSRVCRLLYGLSH